MKAQKVLIHCGDVRDNDLASYAQKIVQRMTNNPNFTDPQPDLATLQAAISVYTAALITNKDSTKENTASKNAARLVVENLSPLKSGTQYVFKATATSPEANKMNTYNFSNPVEKFVP